MLIGIAGKADAGKDTVGDFVVEYEGNIKVNLADRIKAMLNVAFGWTPEDWADKDWKEAVQPKWGFSPRQAAQKLGTEWRDSLGQPTLWCKIVEDELGAYVTNGVVCDVRFPHEQDRIHANKGKVIHVERPEHNNQVSTHSSETSLDLSKIDATIVNDGSLSLLRQRLIACLDELEGA